MEIQKIANTIEVIIIMRKALEEIAAGHDEHQTFSGTICGDIAREALEDVKRVGEKE